MNIIDACSVSDFPTNSAVEAAHGSTIRLTPSSRYGRRKSIAAIKLHIIARAS
jgi:hypothetical protein